jgi:hypothetical protein
MGVGRHRGLHDLLDGHAVLLGRGAARHCSNSGAMDVEGRSYIIYIIC